MTDLTYIAISLPEGITTLEQITAHLSALVESVEDAAVALPDNPASPVEKHRLVASIAFVPDREGSEDLRPVKLGEHVFPEPLNDGRMGFSRLFFTDALEALWDAEDPRLSSVERLTEAEYAAVITP